MLERMERGDMIPPEVLLGIRWGNVGTTATFMLSIVLRFFLRLLGAGGAAFSRNTFLTPIKVRPGRCKAPGAFGGALADGVTGGSFPALF
jgi:hypothetical protein